MQCILRRVEKRHSLIWKSERARLSRDTDVLTPRHRRGCPAGVARASKGVKICAAIDAHAWIEWVIFWLDLKHILFPLKVPLLNDPNTFFVLLFLIINSAPFSLRGLDFGTCGRSLGRGPRLTGFGQGCQQKGDVMSHRIYLSIYLTIYLPIYLPIYLSISLSLYLSISISIYVSIWTGKPEKRSVRVDAARSVHLTLDRGHGASNSFC